MGQIATAIVLYDEAKRAKWEIILVATAIVLYDEANDFSGQMGNNFSSNCYCFV